MGVPKFFRYISERYPCLIEFVKEYQIPEFDNLYLDMNGIIHNCSHPDDNNVHFRITEEKIFQDIFHYIEVLFRMIKPQKLFFMAVDGVAPRAKMNQQRGRRFRSAKEADKMAEEAKKKGEKLPDEARFDSNCITPGTVFMAKLHEQLKYFVVDKISNDPLWQKCKIVLSGHETPGEGEHKIMDYIRYLKSQPGYDPNTRHCLYGLDADLIMLGLCTHEPHFSLLREEVKFGTKKNGSKNITCPEEIVFLLLHLSLMREYLEMEFFELKDKLKGFEYDFEKIIDDWVLMGFLVGNDFIPSLPNLHIANGALPLLYRAYIDILPTLDGYINEAGKLNLKRFEEFMKKLGELDLENFEEIRADIEYMESKTGRKYNHHSKVSMHSPPVRDSGLAALIKETEDIYISSDTEKSDDENSDEDSAFSMYKQEYYKNKLEYTQVTPEVMRDQAEGYVRAIQWNLNYYYNGCCSWSWYYPHHYSPYISDIKGFTNLDIQFDLGKPFKPFEQLLAVLPSASKDLLPKAYHKLMTEESSPIKDYYPEAFQTDLNGKKQEWEAVVLIPFIDEKRLLEAMQNCEKNLTEDEIKRNTHGPMLIYSYTTNDMGPYEAPQYFPKVFHNHAELQTLSIDDIRVPIEKLVKGAFPQTKTGVYFPGFPTFKHLQYKGHLAKEKIKVFETPSRNENMIVTILGKEETDLPKDLLGKIVFASWPHLVEAKVIAVSNSKTKLFLGQNPNNDQNNKSMFDSEQRGILEYYRNRLGIDCGPTTILVHVQLMIGRKYIFSPNGRITLEKQFAKEPSAYPLQTIVKDINAFDTFHSNFRDIESVFAIGSICYTITTPYYGCRAVVQDSKETLKDGRIKIAIVAENEPDFSAIQSQYKNIDSIYMSSSKAAQFVGMRSSDFARITSSIFLTARNGEGGLKRVSVGLNLRFNKKDQETPGYTKKINNYWNYSHKTIELVKQYATKFHEVVAFICNNRFDEGIDVEVIFGDEWEEKLKELNEWLRSLPTHNAERRQCGSEALEPDLVQKIEEVIDNFKPTEMKKITLQIKPNCLYKPEIQTAAIEPDSSMTVELFDRVVNIREGYSVPFGEKGTVIAIQKPQNEDKRSFLYDIVFDKAFKDGMTLNCSEGRGYRLPRTAFINISHGKRLQNKLQGNSTDMKLKLEAFARNPNSAFASYNPAPVPMPRPQGYHQYYPEPQGYFRGPNAQNYIRPRAPFPQKPAFNNFMPNFQQRQPVPPVQILTKKPDNSTCDESIMLKQLLKIGGEDKKGKAQASTSKAFPSPPKTIPPAIPKVENKLNLNEIFAQAANTAPTVRLLTYYQSNGLGLPRYQYFSKDNAFLAQLTLPNGKVVTGKSANTREMASESVAAAVLDIFMKSQTAINTKVFPAPPQKWVNSNQSQENSNDKPQRDNKLKAFNKTNNAYESKKNDGSSKKGNPHAFVPLQVARNQIKQQSSANGSKTQNFKPQEMSSNETTKNHVQKEKIFHNSRKQEKSPTKPRKTRIAANFVKK